MGCNPTAPSQIGRYLADKGQTTKQAGFGRSRRGRPGRSVRDALLPVDDARLAESDGPPSFSDTVYTPYARVARGVNVTGIFCTDDTGCTPDMPFVWPRTPARSP